jgi:toxin ParE1/3/4
LKIVYRLRAVKDLESISAYIARDNPVAAARVVARIVQSLNRLDRFPYSGRPGIKPETRELSVTGLPYVCHSSRS